MSDPTPPPPTVLSVDDPLSGRDVTIAVTLPGSDRPRAERPILVSVGQPGETPVLQTGTFGELRKLNLGNYESLTAAATIWARVRVPTGLPAPCVQEPGLLEPEETAVSETPLSCAQRTQLEEQSLMVNRMAATLAAQFAAEMVTGRQVTQMAAYFNLSPTVMRPRLITETAVAEIATRANDVA